MPAVGDRGQSGKTKLSRDRLQKRLEQELNRVGPTVHSTRYLNHGEWLVIDYYTSCNRGEFLGLVGAKWHHLVHAWETPDQWLFYESFHDDRAFFCAVLPTAHLPTLIEFLSRKTFRGDSEDRSTYVPPATATV